MHHAVRFRELQARWFGRGHSNEPRAARTVCVDATHAVLALVRAEVDIDANVCLSQRMGDASKIFRGIALVKRLTGIHRAT
jgi:hypothetical protein